MQVLLGVVYILIIGIIIGAVIAKIVLKKKFETFKQEHERNCKKDLDAKLYEVTACMCKDCYFKKRCEKLDNEMIEHSSTRQ